MYQCKVMVEAGLDLHSRETKVQTFIQNISVAGRPYMTEHVSSQVTTRLNGTVTLHCLAQAHPDPQVFWLHPGDTPLQPSPGISYSQYRGVPDAVLTISGVTRNDLGLYNCVVKNSIGQLFKEFRVGLVSGAPSVQAPTGQLVIVGVGFSVVMLLARLIQWDLC
ncbi:hypothetical protein ACOMHN_057115 [Nucella lapillus]